MEDPDNNVEYQALGLMSGLEIHYQLDTRRKLFCNCPVGLRNDPPDAEIIRHMRPTLSELGEYDGTALMEFKTKKEVHYQLHYDTVCTYEMDDTPPFPVNKQALDIAIELGLLLNCQIADEIHVSRKQYLDGSIPTGFQRTIAIGVDGWIPFRGRKIRIMQVCLEEDACREIGDVGHVVVFRTDRLSTPLVEVITYPDMHTPEEVMEVDRELGRILRASGKVRRGIGTVRQDVNVSIAGGTRVEIKGVAKTRYIGKLVHYEALRQKALLELKGELKIRGINRETITVDKADCADVFQKTKCTFIKEALLAGGTVGVVKLSGFAGLLNYHVSPRWTLADEMRGRVRVIACLDRPPILLHSDTPETESYPVEEEWQVLKRKMKANYTDSLIIVWGNPVDVQTALAEIAIRAKEATIGIPNETRQVMRSMETDFERILPGPDRMYPDTDSPPIPISLEAIKKIEKHLPRTPESWRNKYRDRLSDSLLEQLIDFDRVELFDRVCEKIPHEPGFIAYVLTAVLRWIARKGMSVAVLGGDFFEELFQNYRDGKISREAIPEVIMAALAGGGEIGPALEKYRKMPAGELAALIAAEAGKKIDLNYPEKRVDYLIGRVKERAGVQADGREIHARLTEERS